MAQNRDLQGTKTALEKATIKIREAAFTSSGWVKREANSIEPKTAPAKARANHATNYIALQPSLIENLLGSLGRNIVPGGVM